MRKRRGVHVVTWKAVGFVRRRWAKSSQVVTRRLNLTLTNGGAYDTLTAWHSYALSKHASCVGQCRITKCARCSVYEERIGALQSIVIARSDTIALSKGRTLHIVSGTARSTYANAICANVIDGGVESIKAGCVLGHNRVAACSIIHIANTGRMALIQRLTGDVDAGRQLAVWLIVDIRNVVGQTLTLISWR